MTILRWVTVKGYGKLQVPKLIHRNHVSRCWVVRLPDVGGRGFGDAAFGDPEKSLAAAVKFLELNYSEPDSAAIRPAQSNAVNAVFAGIRIVRLGPSLYARASHPSGKTSRNFRIGRIGDELPPDAEALAIAKAVKQRKAWLQERERKLPHARQQAATGRSSSRVV